MKIMLVDDSTTMRRIQRGVLTKMGHTDILEARDGMDAMSQAAAQEPDLIVLDWNMPNMSGLEFLKQYRATGRQTPVIMCTTEAEKNKIIVALQEGATNYIVKPFTPDAFSERIQKTIEKAGLAV
jgi:two-component system chemotaxis response regulator CheY